MLLKTCVFIQILCIWKYDCTYILSLFYTSMFGILRYGGPRCLNPALPLCLTSRDSIDIGSVVEKPEVVGIESRQSSQLSPSQLFEISDRHVVRRAHGLRVPVDVGRQYDCRRVTAVQRSPQLPSLGLELLQFDDVVVTHVTRAAQMADRRPVWVKPAAVGQPSVRQ